MDGEGRAGDVELADRALAAMSYGKKVLVDYGGRRGIQWRVSGLCAGGNDEVSFVTLHRDTEAECAADVLDWLTARADSPDSPERRAGAGFALGAASKEELALRLETCGL